MEVENEHPISSETTEKKKKNVVDLVAVIKAWSPRQVSHFLSHLDCDWKARYDSLDQHWIFVPTHFPVNAKYGQTERLMYRIPNGRAYTALRIICILFYKFDPEGTHDIVVECGRENCVHPGHLSLVERRAVKRRRLANTFSNAVTDGDDASDNNK